jgi:hypothetical protein
MIFNKANTARALDTIYGAITKITELWKVCCVVVKGQRARFVSKTLIKAAFVAFRKAGAKQVVITRLGLSNEFRAVGRDTCYTVTATPTAIECTCQDYANQVENLGRGVCKHGYAALGILGFDSLASYLATR